MMYVIPLLSDHELRVWTEAEQTKRCIREECPPKCRTEQSKTRNTVQSNGRSQAGIDIHLRQNHKIRFFWGLWENCLPCQ